MTGHNLQTGNILSPNVVYTGEQLIASIFDTSDELKIANISANFRENFKWDTQGPRVKLIHDLVSDSL